MPSDLGCMEKAQRTDADNVPEAFLPNGKFNAEAIHWLPRYIEDQLYMEMCQKEIEDPQRRYGEKISKYYLEAAKYAGRISAGDFARGRNKNLRPVFRIYFSELTPRLVAELKLLSKEDIQLFRRVVKNAAFRIFKDRHEMIFYQYIEAAPFLFEFLEDENAENDNHNQRIGGEN
jgi:hypothetical protein